jgi:hypothetical protein
MKILEITRRRNSDRTTLMVNLKLKNKSLHIVNLNVSYKVDNNELVVEDIKSTVRGCNQSKGKSLNLLSEAHCDFYYQSMVLSGREKFAAINKCKIDVLSKFEIH